MVKAVLSSPAISRNQQKSITCRPERGAPSTSAASSLLMKSEPGFSRRRGMSSLKNATMLSEARRADAASLRS